MRGAAWGTQGGRPYMAPVGLRCGHGRGRCAGVGMAAAIGSLWLAAVAPSLLVHAPNVDEPAHLMSALAIYRLYRFDIYGVNPPLTRIIGGLGASRLAPGDGDLWRDWTRYVDHPGAYTVFPHALSTFADQLPHSFDWLRAARVVLAVVTVLGPLAVWLWATTAYGPWSGLLATALYGLNPELLHWSGCLNADGLAAAMAAATGLAYALYVDSPTVGRATQTGVVLGLALLTKYTLLLLAVFVICSELAWALWLALSRKRHEALSRLFHLMFVAGIACFVVNLGYGGTGHWRALGEYTFRSDPLATVRSIAVAMTGGLVQEIPLPVPDLYIYGLDVQLHDTAIARPTWVAGRLHPHGVSYFYLYGLLVKLPLGFWILVLWRAAQALRRPGLREGRAVLYQLVPGLLILGMLSTFSTLTVFLRYATPVLPFLIVWTSGLLGAGRPRFTRLAAVVCLLGWQLWAVASAAPHYHAYLNELVGGPAGGYRYFAGPSVSFYEDFFVVRRLWQQYRNKGEPVFVSFRDACRLTSYWRLDAPKVPPPEEFGDSGPPVGWYIVDPHTLVQLYPEAPETRFLHYIRYLNPVRVEGSVLVYHVTKEDAARIARLLGSGNQSSPER